MKITTRRRKGISLIVLVITIIIMIILATSVILSLSSSDIVDKSNTATQRSDFANAKNVAATAYGESMLDGLTGDEEIAYVQNKLNASFGVGKYIAGERGQIAPIPAGFTVSTITDNLATAEVNEDETTIAGGLVIYEGTTPVDNGNANAEQTTRNQFVWIPVEGSFERKAWNGENLQNTYVEPLRQGINYLPNASDIEAHSAEIEQYNKMRESVATYGGFYIGRYEAGDGEATAARTGVTTPHSVVSKKDAWVYNHIGFDSEWVFDYDNGSPTEESIEYGSDINNGCAKLAREAYAGSSSVTSSLIYGVQWDAALKFIEDEEHSMTDSSTWGNHYGNSDRSSISPNNPAKTGACENWKGKNIYDMAGNVLEWTYEAETSVYDFGVRAVRGGVYDFTGDSFTASYRYCFLPNCVNNTYGFRVQLFLK